MAIKLGGSQTVVFRLVVPGSDKLGSEPKYNRIRFKFRNPTTKEKNDYMAKSAAMVPRLSTEDGLRELFDFRMKVALDIIEEVGGDLDIVEGLAPVDALVQYGGDYLGLLAQHVYEGRAEGAEVEEIDLGKSESTSASSSTGSSARSSARRASGSSKSGTRTGMPSA